MTTSAEIDIEFEVRQARHDDYDAVVDFTEDTWSDRNGGDYIPDIFHDWIDDDGEDQRTFVVDIKDSDDIAGIAQCVLLSEYEAWGQGMRVNPEYRGQGIATELTHDLFDWAHDQGAKTIRNMVFSWNGAGLGNSRYVGYKPRTEFRWAYPEVGEREEVGGVEIIDDADAAWRYWVDSEACQHLKGLGLDRDESWALSNVRREDLVRASEDESVIAVQKDEGTTGMAYRVREYERENEEGEVEKYAEYGVGSWKWGDIESCKAVYEAIGEDAAELGADRARVLIPETPEAVSDTAVLRVEFSEDPDFVLGADLTSDYRKFTRDLRGCL